MGCVACGPQAPVPDHRRKLSLLERLVRTIPVQPVVRKEQITRSSVSSPVA